MAIKIGVNEVLKNKNRLLSNEMDYIVIHSLTDTVHFYNKILDSKFVIKEVSVNFANSYSRVVVA